MLKPKQLGLIQLLGALIAGYIAWQNKRWDVLILAALFLVIAFHHFTEK